MQKRLIALTAAVFLAGFAAGSGYTGLKSRAAPAVFRPEQPGSKRIAVVNLDNGIRQAGKQIYYAADAMEFPDANFVSVSAREAELGVARGYPGIFRNKRTAWPVSRGRQASGIAFRPT